MSAPLRSRVLRVLLVQGPWVERAALNRLTTCEAALDDVLADLVIDGHAEFKKYVGYRLCGGPLVRQARLQLLANPALLRAVAADTLELDGGSQVVMGVAERRPELGGAVVVYQMELPPCGSPGAALAQSQALVVWLQSNLGRMGSHV